MISNNRILMFFILLGLAIRLLLSSLPGFNIDVNDWFAWASRLSSFDFSHFYSKDFFSDYTPGYLYILSVLGFLKDLFQLQSNHFYLLLKIPAIISEVIIGLIIYIEAKKYVSERLSLFGLSLILFNPAMIFNSSIWGQIDSVLALSMLMTMLTLKNNHLIISSILFGLALLIKPQAIALAPIFALFLIRNSHPLTLIKLSVPAFLAIFTLSFPFFPSQTLPRLFQHILNTANEYAYTSINAYNLWGIVGFWISDKQIFSNLSYQTWGYILLASYWLLIGYFYLKKKLSIYALATLAALGFFFLPTKVHERYLYPALVFLVLLAIKSKSQLLIVVTVILSFLHSLNLYYVYVYYNELYFKLPKIFYNPIVYNFLETNSKGVSLISTIVFIFTSISILKIYATSSKN